MVNRIDLKYEARGIVKNARVSAYRFTLLVLAITLVLNLISSYVSFDEETAYLYGVQYGIDLQWLVLHRAFPALMVWFVSIVVTLLMQVLSAGEFIYHLGIRRGEEMPYGCLFDGFSFAGKIILLNIVMYIFVFLWSLLFIVPGIIAGYRYRFALYNLCEDPERGVMEVIRMSKEQTKGFKGQLFVLDLSFIGWQLLSSLTLGILGIWVNPYIIQTDIGYFQTIKAIKGAGAGTPPTGEDGDNAYSDDTFHPDDRF